MRQIAPEKRRMQLESVLRKATSQAAQPRRDFHGDTSMKAIVCILKTYLRRERALFFALLITILVFMAHVFLLGSNSWQSWLGFLYAGTMLSVAIGCHLSMVIRCSETDLLPRHRQYQLLAAGGIFTIMFLWSTVALPFAAISPWHVIAFYFLFSSLGLWIGCLGYENSPMAVLAMAILLGMCADASMSADPAHGVSYMERGLAYIGNLWPLYAIIISLLLLIFFCRWFLRGHPVMPRSNRQRDKQIYIATGEMASSGSIRVASRTIHILAKRKTAPFRLVRLLHFGIFSPVFTVNGAYAFVCFISLLVFFLVAHRYVGAKGGFAFQALPLVCVFTTVIFTVDFLSHRTRMPALYLQSRLPSRKAFADAVLYSYLLTAGKSLSYIVWIFIVMTATKFGVNGHVWYHMLQSLLFGFSLSAGVIALSLIYCRRIRSRAPMWILFVIILIVLPRIDCMCGQDMWIIAPVIVAILLLLYAIHRWRNSEMDAAFNVISST